MLNYSTRDMAMVGVLSALSVAMGYTFIFVPNVEMISASIFISGYLLGVPKGIVVAIMAETVFSAFNPMGSGLAFPFLLVSQVIGMSFFGAAGGMLGKWGEKFVFTKVRIGALAAAGFGCTIVYDLLTTLSWPIAAGFSGNQMYATIALGAVFSSIHLISNSLIFVLIVPSILKAVNSSGRFA